MDENGYPTLDEIEKYQREGHTFHCACRILTGDGERVTPHTLLRQNPFENNRPSFKIVDHIRYVVRGAALPVPRLTGFKVFLNRRIADVFA